MTSEGTSIANPVERARRRRQRRSGAARRRGRRRGGPPRAAAEAGVRRLLLERADAARAARSASSRARSPSDSGSSSPSASAAALERVRGRRPGLSQPVHGRRVVSPRRSPSALAAGEQLRPRRCRRTASGSWSSSSAPTRPGRRTPRPGRHAAYGDSLARLLEFAGHDVEREYYVNDYGSQVQPLRRVDPRARTRRGAARGRLPRRLRRASSRSRSPAPPRPTSRRSRARGVELMVERMRSTLARFRVRFDRFFAERSLHESGAIDRALELLAEHGHVYQHDGATWLRTTELGDDKDRVLRRSSGELTYFAADIAYHQDKRERGFDRLIDVWGADHHGYVTAHARCLAGARRRAATGSSCVIMQLVNLIESGQRVQMSKRARRVRHARRPDRRHRRRRRPLLPAAAQPRHDARPRPRPRPRAEPGEPGLLRPVRARADREHPAQSGRGADRARRSSDGPRPASPERLHPSRARSAQAAVRVSRRDRASPPSGVPRTG